MIMAPLHSLNFQRVVCSSAQIVRDLHLREYVFSGFPGSLDPRNFLSSAIGGAPYKDVARIGLIGVAFIYGYPSGDKTTTGLDLAIYRSAVLTKNPLTLEFEHNPMIHTWTLELFGGERDFKVLDRSRDGTFCAVESIIIGRESEKLLSALNRLRERSRHFSPRTYHGNKSNRPDIREFI